MGLKPAPVENSGGAETGDSLGHIVRTTPHRYAYAYGYGGLYECAGDQHSRKFRHAFCGKQETFSTNTTRGN